MSKKQKGTIALVTETNKSELNRPDTDAMLEEMRAAERTDRPRAVRLAAYLAERGVTEAEVRYASYLAGGEYLPPDPAGAKLYFSRAAANADLTAMTRYAEYLKDEDALTADYLTLAAAALGCRDADLAAAEALTRRPILGERSAEEANTYYALAAEAGDRRAILAMIDRSLDGEGMPPSTGVAKWFCGMLPRFSSERFRYLFRLFRVTPVPYPRTEPDTDALLLAVYGMTDRYPAITDRLALRLIQTGHASYTLRLAERYLERGEVTHAEELLRSAAESGDAKAAIALGDLYLSDKLGERDAIGAQRAFSLAAEKGDAVGYRKLGDLYLGGVSGERNLPLAILSYDRAANRGDAEAATKVAKIRKDREDMCARAEEISATSPEEAFRLFTLSDLLGYLPAKVRLAECYLRGIGTDRDRHAAFTGYRDAYEAGEGEALLPFALCYARGIGTARDFRRAEALFLTAERGGDLRGRAVLLSLYDAKRKKLLRRLYSDMMHLVHLGRYEDAVRVGESATELGVAKCAYTLGCLYEFGVGVPCDAERANACYGQARELGYTDPRAVYKSKILKVIYRIEKKA